jgi:hypothetical protein
MEYWTRKFEIPVRLFDCSRPYRKKIIIYGTRLTFCTLCLYFLNRKSHISRQTNSPNWHSTLYWYILMPLRVSQNNFVNRLLIYCHVKWNQTDSIVCSLFDGAGSASDNSICGRNLWRLQWKESGRRSSCPNWYRLLSRNSHGDMELSHEKS